MTKTAFLIFGFSVQCLNIRISLLRSTWSQSTLIVAIKTCEVSSTLLLLLWQGHTSHSLFYYDERMNTVFLLLIAVLSAGQQK